MYDFGISHEKEKAIIEKMSSLGIKEEDIIEKFIKSSGPGGQKVNKSSSCVYLKHIPTGIEVKCQKERSQSLNRYYARKILIKKINEIALGRESEERKRIEKLKRQKRKRSKRAKEKMLEVKHKQSQKKRMRAPVKDNNY
ncbi:MAG: peptide chain release factor-like protein [Armatimonadota bacterium]